MQCFSLLKSNIRGAAPQAEDPTRTLCLFFGAVDNLRNVTVDRCFTYLISLSSSTGTSHRRQHYHLGFEHWPDLLRHLVNKQQASVSSQQSAISNQQSAFSLQSVIRRGSTWAILSLAFVLSPQPATIMNPSSITCSKLRRMLSPLAPLHDQHGDNSQLQSAAF
jgi:hypothetical protein